MEFIFKLTLKILKTIMMGFFDFGDPSRGHIESWFFKIAFSGARGEKDVAAVVVVETLDVDIVATGRLGRIWAKFKAEA